MANLSDKKSTELQNARSRAAAEDHRTGPDQKLASTRRRADGQGIPGAFERAAIAGREHHTDDAMASVKHATRPRAHTATPRGQHGDRAHRSPTNWAIILAGTQQAPWGQACTIADSSRSWSATLSALATGTLNSCVRESMIRPKWRTLVAGPRRHLPTLIVKPHAVASYTSSIAVSRAARGDLQTVSIIS